MSIDMGITIAGILHTIVRQRKTTLQMHDRVCLYARVILWSLLLASKARCLRGHGACQYSGIPCGRGRRMQNGRVGRCERFDPGAKSRVMKIGPDYSSGLIGLGTKILPMGRFHPCR